MKERITKLYLLVLMTLIGIMALIPVGWAQEPGNPYPPKIPKTWDEASLADWATPIAGLNVRRNISPPNNTIH